MHAAYLKVDSDHLFEKVRSHLNRRIELQATQVWIAKCRVSQLSNLIKRADKTVSTIDPSTIWCKANSQITDLGERRAGGAWVEAERGQEGIRGMRGQEGWERRTAG